MREVNVQQVSMFRTPGPSALSSALTRVVGAAMVAGAILLPVEDLFAQPGAAQAGPALAPPLRGELPQVPAPTFLSEPPGVVVTPVATGLEIVWSLEFAPDGRLFITERRGRVRILGTDGVLDPTPWVEFPNVVRLEDGLLGLALHPNFATEPWVYLYYTIQKGEALVNRVSRFREVNGRAGEEQVLIDDLDSNRIHNGGRLRFGPDGMLYISTGELSSPMRSQDLNDLQGKILRITPEGGIPADNPFPGSRVWAYGLRNPHGLSFRPSDGMLFVADNGPTGEWGQLRIGARDEISPVPKGGNLGWPLAVGAPGHPDYVDPIIAWNPSQPPGDLIFYNADLFPELKGNLLFTSLRGETMMRFQIGNQQNPNAITAVDWWFHSGATSQGSRFGRLRAITVGPDGAIYIGTTNFGRGSARENDDKILRITPASQP